MESSPTVLGIIIQWFPMILLIGVWVYFMSRMQSSKGMTYGDFMEKYLEETQRHNDQLERILTRLDARLDGIEKKMGN